VNFDDYKFICFSNGIDPNIIESCRSFIDEHDYLFEQGRKTTDKKSSLGYAECTDIISQNDSIKAVKDIIFMATCDYDKAGRKITKLRTKQLIKNPNKGFLRIVLKSYYLHYHNL
jgi:hypothetical protein